MDGGRAQGQIFTDRLPPLDVLQFLVAKDPGDTIVRWQFHLPGRSQRGNSHKAVSGHTHFLPIPWGSLSPLDLFLEESPETL
jgi:hypothetical protein